MGDSIFTLIIYTSGLISNVAVILLSFRCSRRENLRMIAACGAIFVILLAYLTVFGDSIGLFNVFPPSLWFLFSLHFIHSGSVSQKIFVTCSVLSISHLIFIAASFFATAILGYGGVSFEIVRICVLLVGLAAYVILMARHGKPLLDKVFASAGSRNWGLYVIYPALHFLILRQLYDYVLTPPEGITAQKLFYTLPLFAAAGYILIFTLTVRSYDNAIVISERDMAQQMLSASQSYYENLTDTLDQVRLLQHDYKHQLAVLSHLINSKSSREDALEHLNSMIENYESSENELFSLNPVVDALLNHYAKHIRASGAEFTARIELPKNVAVDNYDLCVVLGNLLDNANIAVKALAENKKRFVKLDIRYKVPQIVICVSNSFHGEIIQSEQGTLKSSRTDGGSGTRSIRAVVQKYGGLYENEWDSCIFSAYVLLNEKSYSASAESSPVV